MIERLSHKFPHLKNILLREIYIYTLSLPTQPKDPVVALHPHYSFSYAPGIVLEVYQNLQMKIRFYDGEEDKLPREEIYKLTPEKFEQDVNYIIECETRWVDQAVVARDDRMGSYHLGIYSSLNVKAS